MKKLKYSQLSLKDQREVRRLCENFHEARRRELECLDDAVDFYQDREESPFKTIKHAAGLGGSVKYIVSLRYKAECMYYSGKLVDLFGESLVKYDCNDWDTDSFPSQFGIDSVFDY
jgi:hypothetical protein